MKQYSLTEYCAPDQPPPCVLEVADVTTEMRMTSTGKSSIAMDHGSTFLEVLGAISLTVIGICVVAWLGWKIFKYFNANQDRVTPAIEYFPGDVV